MKLAKNEIKTFETKEELMEYLKYRSENDIILTPFINETGVVHIPNEPLFIDQYCTNVKLDKNGYTISLPDIDISDEDVESCIREEGGFFMVCPKDNKITVIPMTEYAYVGTCQRTGDECATMNRMEESTNRKVLPGAEKAARLTRDALLYGDSCLLLLRDGLIQTNRSKEFVYFDNLEFVERLEEQLKKDHPDADFYSGSVSRENLLVEYALNDVEMEETFRLALNDAGADVQSLKAGVRFTTSDIGYSALRVTFFYEADGIRTMLDGGITLEHKGENGLDRFSTELFSLGSLFKDAEERIEELGNTDINDVAGCIARIREKYTFLPKKAADDVENKARAKFVSGGTAIDVYLALNEIIQLHAAQETLSPTRYINLSEQVAKLMKLPYDKIDAGEDF